MSNKHWFNENLRKTGWRGDYPFAILLVKIGRIGVASRQDPAQF